MHIMRIRIQARIKLYFDQDPGGKDSQWKSTSWEIIVRQEFVQYGTFFNPWNFRFRCLFFCFFYLLDPVQESLPYCRSMRIRIRNTACRSHFWRSYSYEIGLWFFELILEYGQEKTYYLIGTSLKKYFFILVLSVAVRFYGPTNVRQHTSMELGKTIVLLEIRHIRY